MEEVQSIESRRRAGCSPRVDALDLLRHTDVVPARPQTLACGGDVLRATCLLVYVRPGGYRSALSCASALTLPIYALNATHEKCGTLTRPPSSQ